MTLKSTLVGLGALLSMAATPAAAAIVNFDGGTSTGTKPASQTFNFDGGSVTASAYVFGEMSPASLANQSLSALSSVFKPTPASADQPVLLSYSNRGIGVCTETSESAATGGQCTQVDTNGVNEAIRLSFTGAPAYNILSAVVNFVDSDDTIGIFGVRADNTLAWLGFTGNVIANGSDDFGFTSQSLGGGEYRINFNPIIGSFSDYVFTVSSNQTSGDGYRLRSLTVSAVPEPELWAMLIVGFGLVGLQMRRRSTLATVTA